MDISDTKLMLDISAAKINNRFLLFVNATDPGEIVYQNLYVFILYVPPRFSKIGSLELEQIFTKICVSGATSLFKIGKSWS